MKKRKNLPIFLERYDPLENLVQWREEQSDQVAEDGGRQGVTFLRCLEDRSKLGHGNLLSPAPKF